MDFKSLLNDLLLEKNKSKMELSKEAQIPYTTICGWANGRLPDYNAIIKLSKYFNVSADYILCQEDEFQIREQADITFSNDEKQLLQAYRQMSPGKKKALFNMLDIDDTEIKNNISDKKRG